MLQVLLVDRPGLRQASVALGEAGVSLRDPDAAPLDVLTSVLNNFGGRLFNQIRSREVWRPVVTWAHHGTRITAPLSFGGTAALQHVSVALMPPGCAPCTCCR